jgi:hypothetical protein
LSHLSSSSCTYVCVYVQYTVTKTIGILNFHSRFRFQWHKVQYQVNRKNFHVIWGVFINNLYRKTVPSSLMKNVGIISEYFDTGSRTISSPELKTVPVIFVEKCRNLSECSTVCEASYIRMYMYLHWRDMSDLAS